MTTTRMQTRPVQSTHRSLGGLIICLLGKLLLCELSRMFHHKKIQRDKNGIRILPPAKFVSDPLRVRAERFVAGENELLTRIEQDFDGFEESYFWDKGVFCVMDQDDDEKPLPLHQHEIDRIKHQKRFQLTNSGSGQTLKRWKGRTFRSCRIRLATGSPSTRKKDVFIRHYEDPEMDEYLVRQRNDRQIARQQIADWKNDRAEQKQRNRRGKKRKSYQSVVPVSQGLGAYVAGIRARRDDNAVN